MGPNHFELRDLRAYRSLCGSAKPLANSRKMSLQKWNTPAEMIQSGESEKLFKI
jgi:hypothetical protein